MFTHISPLKTTKKKRITNIKILRTFQSIPKLDLIVKLLKIQRFRSDVQLFRLQKQLAVDNLQLFQASNSWCRWSFCWDPMTAPALWEACWGPKAHISSFHQVSEVGTPYYTADPPSHPYLSPTTTINLRRRGFLRAARDWEAGGSEEWSHWLRA